MGDATLKKGSTHCERFLAQRRCSSVAGGDSTLCCKFPRLPFPGNTYIVVASFLHGVTGSASDWCVLRTSVQAWPWLWHFWTSRSLQVFGGAGQAVRHGHVSIG